MKKHISKLLVCCLALGAILIPTASAAEGIYEDFDVLTKREREIITLMFENSLTAAEIARRWGCSRQSVNQGKIVALKKAGLLGN